MLYVKATVDGKTYYLQQQDNGNWLKLLQAPSLPGNYDVTIVAVTENGNIITIDASDPVFKDILRLIVQGKSIAAARMMNYLPEYWHVSPEMQAILEGDGLEVDRFLNVIASIYTDSFVLTASESRIKEWEQDLKIVPTGTLEQRRLYVLSKLRGQGKLNEAKIKSIVHAFTGGDSIVTFADSTINVQVLPPNNGEVFLFPDIERSISPRKPAHIGLVVERFYSTWGDIKNQFSSWADLKATKADWKAVYNHIAR